MCSTFEEYIDKLRTYFWRLEVVSETQTTLDNIKTYCHRLVGMGYYVNLIKSPYKGQTENGEVPIWYILKRRRRDWKKPRLKIIESLDQIGCLKKRVIE